MAAAVPGPWVRRPISIGLLIGLCAVLPIVFPVALLVGLLADLIERNRRLRRARSVCLISFLLLTDLAGLVLVLTVWLVSPVGLRTSGPRDQSRYRWVMTWWTTALMRVISRFVPMPLDRRELDPSLLTGNAVVVSRHRSLLDAVLPAVIFGQLGLTVLYTLKEDLRWEPNIDVVGHRMGHRFITRSPEDLEAELAPIRELAGRIDEDSVGVIFPEGTFFTEARKERIVTSLEHRDPRHADQARAMEYVLPPRPAGTLALLDGAPDADVIVLGHVGFEQFGSISRILANVGNGQRVTLKAWRFDRSEVPEGEAERIDWLFDRWSDLDRWIATQHHPVRHSE